MATLPSVDTVAEFKMDSNNQKAEYEGAASVTIVTKSGTNEIHGSLFKFNRNKAYTARNFFAPTNPPFNRNEFGFTVGGPIASKTKRSSSAVMRAFTSGRPTLTRCPLQPRPSAPVISTGLRTIIDPLTGSALANNQIPANRIDPRAKALIDRVQLPNATGQGTASSTISP